MSHLTNTTAAVLSLLLLCISSRPGQAQTIQFNVKDIALKSGESTELADVFYISLNCKSLLKGTPTVEILDGPPGVTAVINPANVVPRAYSCANPVAGGKLIVSAKDIQDYSRTRMVLRVNYKTLNGDRQSARNINVTLFPQDLKGSDLSLDGRSRGPLPRRTASVSRTPSLQLRNPVAQRIASSSLFKQVSDLAVFTSFSVALFSR